MTPEKHIETKQEKVVDPRIIKAEVVAEKTSSSKGERLFDWLTYGGIAFAGVFIATMPWTYWNKYGGGKVIHEWITKTAKKCGASDAVAEHTFNTIVLGSIGNAAIVPVKIMENYKPQLVEKFNKMLGDKSSDASIDEEPKQTWWSLIKSRIAAYTACFVGLQGAVILFGGKKFQKFEEDFAEHIVCKSLGKPTHAPGLPKIVANETKAFRYGKIAALDIFATAASSILLYMGSRFFAKKNEHWHAQHTHIPHKNELPAEDKPAPDSLSAAMTTPLDKIHTNAITPRSREIAYKTRPEKFADGILDKKSIGTETPLGMGA